MGTKYASCHLRSGARLPVFMQAGHSIRQIAAALDRAPSSDRSRELKRNTRPQVGYKPAYAQEQAAARRWNGGKLDRKPSLRDRVLDSSPWLVTRADRRPPAPRGPAPAVGDETIYRFIYAQIGRTNDYSWRHYLPRAKSSAAAGGRGGGPPCTSSKAEPHRAARPPRSRDRACGHWEADLMPSPRTARPSWGCTTASPAPCSGLGTPEATADPVAASAGLAPGLPAGCAGPSPSTTAPSSPGIYDLTASASPPSSAIPTPPGRRAASRMPSAACAASFRARPTCNLDDRSLRPACVAAYNATPRKCLDLRTPAEAFSQLLHFKRESHPRPAPG